jgi:hypothetical protein
MKEKNEMMKEKRQEGIPFSPYPSVLAPTNTSDLWARGRVP